MNNGGIDLEIAKLASIIYFDGNMTIMEAVEIAKAQVEEYEGGRNRPRPDRRGRGATNSQPRHRPRA